MAKLSENEWKASGEVFYLRELHGEFAASLKIRGTASRPELFSTQILELPCLMTQKVYDEAKRRGLRPYHKATFSGHLESWHVGNSEKGKTKVYFIADRVENVGGF